MGIRARLDELPALAIHDSQVQSHLYNLVHIALKRLSKSVRLELPKLRTLELILEEDAWVVVDRDLNDIPVIAWLDFQTHHRDNLHEPIQCQRRLYHAHGLVIVDKVIEAMQLLLGERLPDVPVGENPVTTLKRP